MFTFMEFVASQETEDGTIDLGWLKHWKKNIPLMIDSEGHFGDCTNAPCPCELCMIELWLKEYKEYFFEEVRKNQNGN